MGADRLANAAEIPSTMWWKRETKMPDISWEHLLYQIYLNPFWMQVAVRLKRGEGDAIEVCIINVHHVHIIMQIHPGDPYFQVQQRTQPTLKHVNNIRTKMTQTSFCTLDFIKKPYCWLLSHTQHAAS